MDNVYKISLFSDIQDLSAMNSKELKDIGDQYSFEKVKEEMEKCWIAGLLKDLDAHNASKHSLVRTLWGWDGQENPLLPG